MGEKERCEQFGEDLNQLVPVKSLGELKWYSGCYYERDRKKGRLTISWQTYTVKLGEKYGVAWEGSVPTNATWRLWGFDLTSRMLFFLFAS